MTLPYRRDGEGGSRLITSLQNSQLSEVTDKPPHWTIGQTNQISSRGELPTPNPFGLNATHEESDKLAAHFILTQSGGEDISLLCHQHIDASVMGLFYCQYQNDASRMGLTL